MAHAGATFSATELQKSTAAVSPFSATTVKMKLLPFFYSLSAAKKDICLGSGDNPLDSNETPSYGGTCWDNWVQL